jgi:hypothetical protein
MLAMRPVEGVQVLLDWTGITLALVMGAWYRFQINARRFRRRTIGGGQRFPTYATAVFTQLWEGIVIWGATLLMAAAAVGGLWLAIAHYRFG